MRKKKNDIILIGAALLIAAVLWLGISLFKSPGAYALVTVNGEEYGRYSLSEDTEVEIKGGEHKNLLVIKDGCAEVTGANCPDRLCVKMGKISLGGQSIICLPNRVVVEIVGGEKQREDVIAR